MSEKLTCPAEGITGLILEALAGDAVIVTVPEADMIQVTVRPVAADRTEPPHLAAENDQVRLVLGIATRVDLPPGVALTVEEALGDLRVRDFEADLRIQTVRGDLRLGRTGARVAIEAVHGDVRAEGVAALHIGDCEGDLRCSAGGELEVERVGGDLRVAETAAVHAGRVNGDLWSEKLTGGLHVEGADGEVRLSDIGGQVVLGQVAGDLRAAGLAGGLSAGHVRGDAIIDGPFPGEEGYTLRADGDAHIRLAGEDDVRLVVRAAGRIRASLPLTPTSDGTPTYSATVRDGKVRVIVTSGGDLRIEMAGGGEARGNRGRRRTPETDAFGDLSGLGDRIREQVAASLAAAGINPDKRSGPGARGPVWVDKGFQPPTPPERPKAAGGAGGTTGNEQMASLKMLEEGRITPEEADALLRAMGA
jgi:hypothetical protein